MYTKSLLALLFLSSCGASGGLSPKPARPAVKQAASDASCRNGTSLTYENFGEGFFLNYCVNCHASDIGVSERLGAPINVNFDTYDDIVTHRRDILKTAARSNNPQMPPSRHVSLNERALLSEWLQCGAPGDRSSLP